MRSILVNADRSPGMGTRLDTALALARANNGHVTLLVDTPVARYIAMDPMGGSFVASDALKRAIADDDAAALRLEERLAREGVPFDVIRSEAEPVEALAKAARLADVVVVSRSSGLAGDLALTTRTSVLALADGGALSLPLASACIAWDGGDEAACALRHAVPLLAGCASIHVITVAEKPGGFPATAALRYLSRHGLKAELDELPRRGSTEETLEVGVGRIAPDVLVMGAFGHSRVRQFLFGGVTRHFLEKQNGPALLLAH